MKKVLVIGGNGFLGYYLVNELLNRNYDVTVADIKDDKYFDRINFIKTDISNDRDLNKLFKNKFDFIYNLAGVADLDIAIKNPIKSFELNTMSNLKILDMSLKNGVKHFVYASSAYASSIKGSFYGISKLTSEKIIEEYHKKFKLNYTILRYGSVYSEKNFKNNYIFNLIEKISKNNIIDHHGDGLEIREYIHATDAANMSVNVIENPEYLNQSFILTGIERIKRNELFSMIKEISGKDFKINYLKGELNNHYNISPYSFQPSVAKKLISNPQIDLGQGLLSCIRTVWNNDKN